MPPQSPPQSPLELDAPGAGLPPLERIIARLILSTALRLRSRDQCAAEFANERARIGALVQSTDAESAMRPVLIDRIRGMEDSSRYWSVFMTLDHLRIVNLGFAGVIRSLGRGVVPEGQIGTADVKPDPEADNSAIDGFERSCDRFLKCAADIADLDTAARFAHPWFGAMTAAGWHALGGLHMRIHRRQIERILRGLTEPS